MQEVYTYEQIAERYGVKALTVLKWTREKRLPAIKVGKSYRVRREDMEAFERAQSTMRPD